MEINGFGGSSAKDLDEVMEVWMGFYKKYRICCKMFKGKMFWEGKGDQGEGFIAFGRKYWSNDTFGNLK